MRVSPVFLVVVALASFAYAQNAAAQQTPSAHSSSQARSEHAPVLTGTPVQRRAKIRICGSEWEEMKRTGKAFGMTWQDFSRGCFARPLPPNAPP
ncbi:MAG TPA: hypothetical protein VMU56_03010 [Beijerinckiaceae bacterium]|nr:hypothetical protein [Beijerinckiaceae bacterium]HVB90050.1 hypothetical protein [Beijerinckiaceae bacterium]